MFYGIAMATNRLFNVRGEKINKFFSYTAYVEFFLGGFFFKDFVEFFLMMIIKAATKKLNIYKAINIRNMELKADVIKLTSLNRFPEHENRSKKIGKYCNL